MSLESTLQELRCAAEVVQVVWHRERRYEVAACSPDFFCPDDLAAADCYNEGLEFQAVDAATGAVESFPYRSVSSCYLRSIHVGAKFWEVESLEDGQYGGRKRVTRIIFEEMA
ncbi:MAG: hypothetical protein WC505_06055 [Patescibacteria group bacterium]